MDICSESKTRIGIKDVTTPIGVYTIKACGVGVHSLSLEGVTDENFDPHSIIGMESKAVAVDVDKCGESAIDVGADWLVSYFTPSNIVGLKNPPVCFPKDSSTEFERKVWTALGQGVGFGDTITYSALGEAAINNPRASRAVGTAMKKNPIPLIIPCHRVIRSDGQIGNYAGGKINKVKKWLLEYEKGTVDIE